MTRLRALHWFRSDLRVRDNTALRAAAERADELACVFVFDPRLLASAGAPRVRFMVDCVRRLAHDLEARRRARAATVDLGAERARRGGGQ